jgi:hypothetical protein
MTLGKNQSLKIILRTLQETCFYKYMLGGATAESAGCISSLKTVHIQPLMLMMQNNFQTLIIAVSLIVSAKWT